MTDATTGAVPTAAAAAASPAPSATASPSSVPTSTPLSTPSSSPSVTTAVSPQSCLAALGPAPVVDSTAALRAFAAQLHVLTTPLPTPHAQAQLKGLEDNAQGALERLDELSALVEALKHGASQAGSDVLPAILARQAALPSLFQRVHAFSQYLTALDTQLRAVEKRVGQVDGILRATAASEAEQARSRGAGGKEQGVTAKAERSARQLFSSFMNLGSKPASGNSAANASASGGSDLDLLDDIGPPVAEADIAEWFGIDGSAAAKQGQGQAAAVEAQ